MSHDTDLLLDRAAAGDSKATDELFARHRDRLRRMIYTWLDGRVRARVDPSDVVQETLVEAHRQLPKYLPTRPLAFYPWLRGIAAQRLDKVHRQHLRAQRRSVTREEPLGGSPSRESIFDLADKLIATSASPSQHAQREEMRRRTRAALAELAERDREFLILRYVEQLSMREIAEITGATEAAVKMRHVRALERLRALLDAL
jgi:RNA polymerase sigma-70 factor (ECF subfamily)